MSVYGSGTYLLPNQVYNVTLRIPGVEPYSFSFTSRYAPLYTTAKTVRSDCGEALDGLSDDAIWYAIWLTSKSAEELLVEKELTEAANTRSEQTAVTAELLNSNRSLKYAFSQYVRYRTALDLVRAAYLGATTKAGQLQKKLGDLTILKETRAPTVDMLLERLEQDVSRWESRLAVTTRTRVIGAVRAGADSFPLNTRRSF